MWRCGRLALVAALLLSSCVAPPSSGVGTRQTITMWFWGATPAYRQALDEALVTPFNKSQSKYQLVVEYRRSVDNDVRVAAVGGGGPDLVYTSGTSDVLTLARAGKLAPLDNDARRFNWAGRLQAPLLQSCVVHGHLYCLPLGQEADGMFYNKAVLKSHGWPVPTTGAEVEDIMRKAQAAGLYASVTGNRLWQPVNENYSTIFLNQYVGPQGMACLVAGRSSWTSPRVVHAMEELKRWYRSGFLGGHDYFALDFDISLLLLKEGRSPFFFAPTMLLQWAPKYFSGDEADKIGFAPMPRLSAYAPYPDFDLGTAFTYSINAKSKVKDGAAQVLNMMLSPKFVTTVARNWPAYWAPPLANFPDDPNADATGRLYYASMKAIASAVARGDYGYRTGTFLPPNTKDVFIQDVEAVWLGEESVLQMLQKVQRTFDHEETLGLVRAPLTPMPACPAVLSDAEPTAR